jgi:tetratricopeptide (TPR) repeat protein
MQGIDTDELLARYEARGNEEDYLKLKDIYEQQLALSPGGAGLHLKYGYLIECHARVQLRKAVAEYERAIELDPERPKAHYQLIGARAGLLEPEIPIGIYERRLARSPDDLDSHRLLVAAYLAEHRYADAQRVIDAGLALGPNDPALIRSRGEVRAGTGDTEGALADWRYALQLDPEDLSGVYASAFLLEREGRPEEAIEQWRYIVEWSNKRGFSLDTEWPMREIERLQGKLSRA